MSTTPTPQPNVGQEILTDLEKTALAIVAAAPAIVPVFVHSQKGILIVNASEALLASLLQQFAPKG